MRYTRIRGLRRDVSLFGFGCRSLSRVDDEAGAEIIQVAVDQGINLFDTAPNYGSGRSESVLGEGLKGYRDDVILCTKAGLTVDGKGRHLQDSRPETIRGSVEASLRRLQTDHVNILTLHYPDPVTPPAETIPAILQLMEQGKILHFGVSNFDSQELARWIGDIEIVTAQTPYNLLLTDIEEDLLPLCREKEITVLGYVPLLAGLLTEGILRDGGFPSDDARSQLPEEVVQGCREIVRRLRDIANEIGCTVAQLALAWTLVKEGLVPLVGTTNEKHLRENVEAIHLDLEEVTLEQMEEVVSDVDPEVHSPMSMRVERLIRGYDGSRVGVLDMGFKARLPSLVEKGDTVLMDPWTGEILGSD